MLSYHLQSYFVYFSRTALASELMNEFRSSYVPVSDKYYVITSYEIGFSRRAMDHGLTLDAVYPLEALVSSLSRVTLASGSELAPNPTLELWEEFFELGSPFVKAQLLRELAPDPRAHARACSAATLRLASAHLERTNSLTVANGADPASVDAAADERP